MADRVCIVTGGNSGIGFELCRGMAAAGYHVVMVSRGIKRGQKALNKLQMEFGNNVEMMLCDMSDLRNITKLYSEFINKFDRLDVLLNNAGALWGKKLRTTQGQEMTFGVNHLGYFVMTQTFLPILKTTENSRIINTASEAHKMSRLNLEDLNFENRRYSQWLTYSNSKLCNILFTRELARRLEGTNVITHCFHPGVVRTRFAEDASGPMRLFWPLVRIFMIGSKRGAKTGLHLALSNEAGKSSGQYWINKKRRRGNRAARNDDNATKLWIRTEEILDGHQI
ncbi:MAG: SDR family oxidoreductase [Candidatus Poseidoniaceae archaeon]|jgi:NAD(P)-dependent dehydrogenase (short-subunit alcohol dehydrogenase family)|nr:SDR family oxidoreductase [Candidatus Poseidoniaceae archaeon]